MVSTLMKTRWGFLGLVSLCLASQEAGAHPHAALDVLISG